jgi:ribosomal protein L14
MPIRANGSYMRFNVAKTSAVIINKDGHFVGFREIGDLIRELQKAKATGDMMIALYETADWMAKRKSEQQALNFNMETAR